jgi:hypothetical protein
MALIDRDREPTAIELRVFGVLLAAFCGLVGGLIVYHTQSWTIAGIVWSGGVLISIVYYAAPSVQRLIFHGWMALLFPVGWLLSHALLAMIYYGVITPIGLALKLYQADLLRQQRDSAATSYWVTLPPQTDVKQYFKQF